MASQEPHYGAMQAATVSNLHGSKQSIPVPVRETREIVQILADLTDTTERIEQNFLQLIERIGAILAPDAQAPDAQTPPQTKDVEPGYSCHLGAQLGKLDRRLRSVCLALKTAESLVQL
jgi:hypothetical protein